MISEFMIGTAIFLAIKFAGYRYAGVLLNGRYAAISPIRPSVFGISRMILGLIVSSGSALTIGSMTKLWGVSHELPVIYALLIPVRLVEWLFIVWLFYERRSKELNWMRLTRHSVAGTVLTYILDVPAGFVAGNLIHFC